MPVFVPGEHPNVPSFRFSFRGNIRQNTTLLENQPFGFLRPTYRTFKDLCRVLSFAHPEAFKVCIWRPRCRGFLVKAFHRRRILPAQHKALQPAPFCFSFNRISKPIFGKGMDEALFSEKRGFSGNGGGNSVNQGFGKHFYRKGNSVKRFGPFTEPQESEN